MLNITNISKTITDTFKEVIESQATKNNIEDSRNVQIRMFIRNKDVSEANFMTLVNYKKVADVSLSGLLGAFKYMTFNAFNIDKKIVNLLVKNIEKHNIENCANFSILVILNKHKNIEMRAYDKGDPLEEIDIDSLID